MIFNIKNLKVNYEAYLNEFETKNIILLHGWGSNIKSFKYTIEALKNRYNIYALDMPGFGDSDMVPYPYNVIDYANIVNDFIIQKNISDPILIGHSFGGRIIIKLVGFMNIKAKKIVLVDSAGIKPKRTIIYIFKLYLYKLLKQFKYIFGKRYLTFIRNIFGSKDYNMVGDVLKKTLINVVNEDLKEELRNIKIPTLIIWGEDDKTTPLKDAKIMNDLISDSGLVIFKNAGHYSYIDKHYEFLKVITYFIDN